MGARLSDIVLSPKSGSPRAIRAVVQTEPQPDRDIAHCHKCGADGRFPPWRKYRHRWRFFKTKSDHKAPRLGTNRTLGCPAELGRRHPALADDGGEDCGLTVWHVAQKDSKWFSPSESSFMINYRVDNLDELLEQLRKNDVKIVGGPEDHDNGRFAWIMDPTTTSLSCGSPRMPTRKEERVGG